MKILNKGRARQWGIKPGEQLTEEARPLYEELRAAGPDNIYKHPDYGAVRALLCSWGLVRSNPKGKRSKYVRIRDTEVARTDRLYDDWLFVDLDADGRIVGVEVV